MIVAPCFIRSDFVLLNDLIVKTKKKTHLSNYMLGFSSHLIITSVSCSCVSN